MKKIVIYVFLAVVIGTALLAAGFVGAARMISSFKLHSEFKRTTENIITVKGMSEKLLTSDVGSCYITLTVSAQNIEDGYKKVNSQVDLLKKKLAELGIKKEEIENISLNYEPIYEEVRIQEKNGRTIYQREFKHYSFAWGCRLRTTNVKILEQVSVELYALSAAQIQLSVTSPEYYISNPEQYKLELIDSATRAAYERAKIIADTCHASLGKLLVARQGVIQITPPASNDTSDQGVYDTRTIEKVMRMVVTLNFALK